MGAPEDEHIFGVQLRESANDGSDFPNADADYRKLFLGEDGILHLKDSAGTVTDIGGGGITVEDEGTPLATTATTLDFVGAGVVASGTGATKTITISGGGGGGMTLLEQHTASSSASLDFTSFISGSHDVYLIDFVDIVPATNTASLNVLVGTGGGPTWQTGSTYAYYFTGRTSTTASALVIATNMSNNAAFGPYSGQLRVTALESTVHPKTFTGNGFYANAGPAVISESGGGQWYGSLSTPITGIQVIMSSGNIATGTVRIYGLEK